MTVKERIFQAILFEGGALGLSWLLVKLLSNNLHNANANAISANPVSDSQTANTLIMLVGISVIAMIWTFIYNVIFDKFFTGEKLARPVWVRAVHIIGFEAGLLAFTLPLVMWLMDMGLWEAFLLDISLSLMILMYGFVFYWVYDWVRVKWVKGR